MRIDETYKLQCFRIDLPGVYKYDGPFDTFVDSTGIPELYRERLPKSKNSLFLGANVSLNRCIEIFQHVSKNVRGYHYLSLVANHWKVIANTGIRNVS